VKQYIGVKVINAKPMTRAEYNTFRGWTLPADENGDDAGFLVEYTDGGRGNTDHYAGYVSWSPADVFDRAYRLTTGMTFGLALEAVKLGQLVQRAGWNGKGLKLGLVGKGGAFVHSFAEVSTLPYIVMAYPHDAINTPGAVVPWLASQTDMLAEDWEIVP
jgi:hypothetical protein